MKAFFGFLFLLLCVCVFGCQDAANPATPSKTVQSQTNEPDYVLLKVPVVVDWPIADYLLLKRSQYMYYLPFLEGAPDRELYSAAYFRELKERRQRVMDWTKENKPTVVFVGQVHIPLTQRTTEQERAEIQRFQDWCFDQIKGQQGVDLIAIEESGSDERVSVEIFAGITLDQLAGMGVRNVPREAVLNMIDQDQQASTRAIKDASGPPVFCGEEWPLRFESFGLMHAGQVTTDSREAFDDFQGVFNRLRSEIILIRALERLQRIGGKKALIIQGAAHAKDMEDFQKDYNIQLKVILPK